MVLGVGSPNRNCYPTDKFSLLYTLPAISKTEETPGRRNTDASAGDHVAIDMEHCETSSCTSRSRSQSSASSPLSFREFQRKIRQRAIIAKRKREGKKGVWNRASKKYKQRSNKLHPLVIVPAAQPSSTTVKRTIPRKRTLQRQRSATLLQTTTNTNNGPAAPAHQTQLQEELYAELDQLSRECVDVRHTMAWKKADIAATTVCVVAVFAVLVISFFILITL